MDTNPHPTQPPLKAATVTAPGFVARCTAMGVLLLAVAGCGLTKAVPETRSAPTSGRQILLEALAASESLPARPRQDEAAGLSAGSDSVADGFVKGSHAGEPPPGRTVSITLGDGTVTGGLLFEYTGAADGDVPLLMAGFGFFQDRWGAAAEIFCRDHVADPDRRLPAHVFIVDHPSSGPFLAANGVLSIGGYDDARMWVGIARQLKRRMGDVPIHLLGVGGSGQTVVHALAEDHRLGGRLFASGLAVSATPDSTRVPGRPLALLPTAGGQANPWPAGRDALRPPCAADAALSSDIVRQIDSEFIPGYRRVNPAHASFAIPAETIPIFFYRAFDNRLAVLRNQQRPAEESWSRQFSLENLEAYMRTTRIAKVVGGVRSPLLLLSAQDDPWVPRRQFEAVRKAAARNPWVVCYETTRGGHGEHERAYGRDYIGQLLQLMMDPLILATWQGTR